LKTTASGDSVFLGKTVLSGVATADISLPDTYDSFYVEYYFEPATDGVDLRARFTTDGFSTVESGAGAYKYSAQRENTGEATDRSDSATTMVINVNQGNAAGKHTTGSLNVINAKESAPTHIVGLSTYLTTSGLITATEHNGFLVSTNNVDGVQFYMSSGNLTGFVKVWAKAAA
jgi:hypothetical protein